MTPSPFHGIFSAFGQGDDRAPALSPPGNSFAQGMAATRPRTQGGQIAVDIYEQDDYYIVRAPIAGVRLADIDIEVDGKVITLRGVRRPAEELPADQYYLQECYWGEFSRSITLPCMIDPKKVKATFSKDCILKILVPKEERVKIVRVSEG